MASPVNIHIYRYTENCAVYDCSLVTFNWSQFQQRKFKSNPGMHILFAVVMYILLIYSIFYTSILHAVVCFPFKE